MKNTLLRISAVAVLALSSAIVVAPATNAAGTSIKTNGCYVQWWNTAWAARCSSATKAGEYRAIVTRDKQLDLTTSYYKLSKGYSGTFTNGEANWGMDTGSRIQYREGAQ